MLTGLLIKSMGFIFSLLPYSILEFATELLGFVFVSIPSARRRLLFSNLKHSFPYWGHAKIKSVARKSSARMFEMGFFSLTYPFLSKDKLKRTMLYSKKVEGQLEEYRRDARPMIVLLPHISLFETLVTSPYFRPQRGKRLGAIYRPNRNPVLDRWINRARVKSGLKIFARKAGLFKARDHLRDGNWLIVLFDQNAGKKGARGVFLDRLCSISPLPDLLGRTPDAQCIYAFPRRTAFFQSQLELKTVPPSQKGFSVAAHGILEGDLKASMGGLSEWLWLHGKWKTNDMPHEFFHLQETKKSKFDECIPVRKTKLWIRMPNWLGDIVMALPLIRAIRSGRPDASVTLLCKKQYVAFLESLKICENVTALPDAKGLGYFCSFLKWRKDYPDGMLVLTNSLRGDLEAFLVGAKLRFGMIRKNRRPFLNATWVIPKDSAALHQTKIWGDLLGNFGLRSGLDLSPLSAEESVGNTPSRKVRIGVAPGSSNTPAKRLPVESWIEICSRLLAGLSKENISIELFGTISEKKACGKIKNALQSAFCIDRSGKTTLVELMKSLKEIDLLLCNDSGSMHLANCLGTPVLALFGPTDPASTGPIFNSPKIILESSPSNRVRVNWGVDIGEVEQAAYGLIPSLKSK
jgi:heptosyltransferase II